MKKIFLALLLFSSTLADGNECGTSGHRYVGTIGGGSFPYPRFIDSKDKVGYFGGLFAGYKFNTGLRLEGELSYSHNKIELHRRDYWYDYDEAPSWNFNRIAVMGNALYSFALPDKRLEGIKPYFGVGLGCSYLENAWLLYSNKKYRFTWQGIAGVSVERGCYTFGIDYRRISLGNDYAENAVGFSIAKPF